MAQELVETKAPLKAGGGLAAIVPQDAEQAYRMATLIARSGIAPRDMQTPEKLVTAILHGLEVGLKPMQAVQSIAIVNGRPCIWGDAALGLVRGSGLLADLLEATEGEGEGLAAVCRARRVGQDSPIERRFSVADAKAAGLWGKTGPWTQYPRRMLQMRARSWALRDGFADVLKGLAVTEEVRDFSAPQAMVTGTVTRAALLEQAQEVPALAAPAPEPEPEAAPERDWPAWQREVLAKLGAAPTVGAANKIVKEAQAEGAPEEILEIIISAGMERVHQLQPRAGQ